MNHHQRKVLQAIFAHPVNANLDMKDVVNVLNGLGARSTRGRRAGSGSSCTGTRRFCTSPNTAFSRRR